MPKTLQQLTIFVSGPTGTESEKAALQTIAEEITHRLEKTQFVTLRVTGWPESIRPSVGLDVQAEVDRQVGESYDIYIGIFGHRFGTPTPRAGSGTEEEFNLAFKRFQDDSTCVKIMFYFNHTPIDPFTIDIDQLQRVLRFRENLRARGVLYSDFNDTAEFANLVRKHLDNLIIDEWRENTWSSQGQSVPEFAITDAQPLLESNKESEHFLVPQTSEFDQAAESSEDDERGILEYATDFHEASVALVEVMLGITRETVRVGEAIQVRTSESEKLNQQIQSEQMVGGSRMLPIHLTKARETVDHAASDLNDFVAAMSAHVGKYKFHNRLFFDSLAHLFSSRAELGKKVTAEEHQAISEMIRVIENCISSNTMFQSTINSVPALTGKFKRARQRASAVLGELTAEMSFATVEAKRLLDEAVGELCE